MSDQAIHIALVRHGQSTANRAGHVLGRQLSPDLTALGRAQARAAAGRLRDFNADSLWSSDMVRALRTAQFIALATGRPVSSTVLLREQDHGAMDGMDAVELAAEPTPPGRDITEIRWGGGESIADVYARVRHFMMVLAARRLRRVIVVGHSDMLCVASSMLAGRGHRQIVWDRFSHGEVRYAAWDGVRALPS